MRVAKLLVRGVDVWLNNPRRPLEASGTSGMKASANGVVNLSVLDGWWDEGWTGDNGWAIGGRVTNPDEGAQDWADALDLYRILEDEVVPRYYERDAAGLPHEWLALMKRSMATTIWRFSTTRMLHEYAEQLYLPAAGVDLAALGGKPAPARHRGGLSDHGPAPGPESATDKGGLVAPRISLALALHNHQPVGNFGWVFGDVYETAYRPMLDALDRHPGVRLALHYTGPLLDWLRAERPEFIERLPGLVARGQVELLGGGYYEPVLASLPERDRVGQLRKMADEIERITGRRPRGAWLAERVWEPDLPDRARRGRLRLDDPGRQPLPGRRDPGGEALGSVHHRRPGQPPDRLRDREGPALPDPVRRRGRRDRLPPRPRDRGGRPGRDDGRRRREVRVVAHHVGALLGRQPLGRPLLRGARGERGLAHHDHAVGLARPERADRPRLRADGLVRGDGRVGAAARREPRLHRACSTRRRRPGGPRRATCAAASGATSRSSTARSTTSTSRCCGPRRRSTAMPAGPARPARSTTCSRASPTTATGTASSAGSTSATCGWPRTST